MGCYREMSEQCPDVPCCAECPNNMTEAELEENEEDFNQNPTEEFKATLAAINKAWRM